jgi:phosphoenolpyruvate---glycerone phosphotransferase subunit DhaL
MLTRDALAAAVTRLGGRVGDLKEALNAADRRLGDGDTGNTVEQIVHGWSEIDFAVSADVGDALVAMGRAAGRASGSSLGAVVATGFGAAGRAVRGRDSLDAAGVREALDAAMAAIEARSGASRGDKTLLDSIAAIAEALDGGAPMRGAATRAADAALDAYRDRESRLGRARMYGARSRGCDDPGMLAVALVLKTLD